MNASYDFEFRWNLQPRGPPVRTCLIVARPIQNAFSRKMARVAANRIRISL